jgi:mannose-6-phosphate isomerase-like protein (cupin superfamily)
MKVILPTKSYPIRSVEEMENNWVVRQKQLTSQNGQPIQSYSLIGDTTGQFPNAEGLIKDPHGFQLSKKCVAPNTKTNLQKHNFVTALFSITGKWRVYWGSEFNEIDGELELEQWDLISIPEDVWYRYENIDSGEGWMFEVKENHEFEPKSSEQE